MLRGLVGMDAVRCCLGRGGVQKASESGREQVVRDRRKGLAAWQQLQQEGLLAGRNLYDEDVCGEGTGVSGTAAATQAAPHRHL